MAEAHSPAFKICNYWYTVLIAPIYIKSEAQFRVTGVVSSGNLNRDREALLQPEYHQLRIADMAELLADGAQFALVEPEKSVVIYNTIVELLTEWRMIVERTIVHSDEVPMQYLQQLDALAVEIYKTARVYIKPADQIGFFNRIDIFNQRPMPSNMTRANTSPIVKPVKKEHTPIADAINAKLTDGGIPWR